ncbi:LytR C-terminal domain-containing protein [Janthinobacterium sp. HLX7-2]|uniref:LytR C-terminal domain-containing protein n=1 Tax=Janthinobacterium sp. HLX7-2 TaxID=1259331 RepID=UPI003F1EC6B3
MKLLSAITRLPGLWMLACLLQGCAAPLAPAAWNIQAVQRINNSAGQNAATYFELGKFYQERGQLQLAAEAYAVSIALDPRQLGARNAQAVLDARLGRLEQAASALRELVSEYPQAAQPMNNLGYVYYLQGELAQASSMLEQAVARDGGRQLARNNLQLVQAAQVDAAAPAAVSVAVALQAPGNIEIINGNGIRGMAAQVRLRVQVQGIVVSRLGNLPGFRHARSQILYAPGNERQASALRLAVAQPGQAMKLVPVDSLGRGAGVRLILGRDQA